MKLFVLCLSSVVALAAAAPAAEFHVALTGSDTNAGTPSAPLRTIQRGADLAKPGDVITVHAGVYRERISPPRGGASDRKRIVYQAAKGEKVEIKGSEPIKGWEKVQDDTWKATVPNSFFGGFNPYSDLIHGDWFDARGRQHHTGAVYLHGDWLIEAAKLDDLLKPVGGEPLWFGQVEKDKTVLWAQFKGVNPNEAKVEINVRQTVFTPEKTGIDYITVRGFDMRHAAPPWAPPTAKQIGIVSALWCKGWIIEDNEISYSSCSGIALGKYGDEWDNRAESAEGYVGTLNRALTNGWNKATVGSHVVRNNHIHHCGQTGVVGSLGCSFSSVTGNVIHDIHLTKLFGGAEMAGIKFHGAIDVTISNNHIYRCGDVSGIWLDWMGQGAQVTCNLLHDNNGWAGDLFLEMQHGPLLVANNLFLSKAWIYLNAKGIALAHNLIASPVVQEREDGRLTPFHKPHATEVAGL
ncbi:MAG: right-handed parallel beta-helix repeat-containing protein, partial [bacterium]